jgi:hypothetical protein
MRRYYGGGQVKTKKDRGFIGNIIESVASDNMKTIQASKKKKAYGDNESNALVQSGAKAADPSGGQAKGQDFVDKSTNIVAKSMPGEVDKMQAASKAMKTVTKKKPKKKK